MKYVFSLDISEVNFVLKSKDNQYLLALSWIEIKHKQDTANERTHLFIILILFKYPRYKEKLKKKSSELMDEKKVSKAIEENELTVMIKGLSWEFNLYWKLMCADENNNKNKTNLPQPLTLSFLNC